jgi:hypothetical protein
VRGQIVGGASGRSGDEHAVANELGGPHLVVDQDAYLGGLASLAK